MLSCASYWSHQIWFSLGPEMLLDLVPDSPLQPGKTQLPVMPPADRGLTASQVTTQGSFLALKLQVQAEEPTETQHQSDPEKMTASTALAETRTRLEQPAQRSAMMQAIVRPEKPIPRHVSPAQIHL